MRLFEATKRRCATPRWFFLIIQTITVAVAVCGCTLMENVSMDDEVRVPGCNEYSILIKKDRDAVLPGGTYSYGPEGSTVRSLRGGRGGYLDFFDLTLTFKLKDGRDFHEKIDIRSLMVEAANKHEIPDLTETRWGGGATLLITIEADNIFIVYELHERIWKDSTGQMFYKYYRFPVFEKRLVHEK